MVAVGFLYLSFGDMLLQRPVETSLNSRHLARTTIGAQVQSPMIYAHEVSNKTPVGNRDPVYGCDLF